MSIPKKKDEDSVGSHNDNENQHICPSLKDIPIINNIQQLNCGNCKSIKQIPQLRQLSQRHQSNRVYLIWNQLSRSFV